MRIKSFDIRPEHVPFVKEWEEKNNVTVDMVEYGLDKENAYEELKGYDGVSVEVSGNFDSEIYPILKDLGIRNIAQRTAGFENFDLKKASEDDIIFTNVPSYSPESIAEFTLYMALKLIRKGTKVTSYVNDKYFIWDEPVRGRVLREMTIGIFGTGRIGYEVAKIFNGLGAKVLGYDIYPNEELKSVLTYVDSVEELVQQSDIVSLHAPSTEQNHHLFNKEMFKLFKKDSYLLNAGRGQLVKTEDLIWAIDNDYLSSAALDTYENEIPYIPGIFTHEPIKDTVFETILNHPKIDFTHHMAFYTDTSVKNMMHMALDATKEIIETGTTDSRVN